MSGKGEPEREVNPQPTVGGLYPGTRALLKTIAIYLLGEVFLLALGIAFVMLVHGLVFLFIYIATYWKPAYIFLVRLAPSRFSGDDFNPASMTWLRLPWFLISLSLRIAMIILGVWLLIKVGFCGQNLICMFAG